MAAQAIAGAIGQIAGVAGKFAEAKNTRLQGTLADKQGFQDTQSRLLQLRQQREAQRQQLIQEQQRTRRTTIIVISVVLGLLLISTIIFFALKSKKQ